MEASLYRLLESGKLENVEFGWQLAAASGDADLLEYADMRYLPVWAWSNKDGHGGGAFGLISRVSEILSISGLSRHEIVERYGAEVFGGCFEYNRLLVRLFEDSRA